MVVSYASFTHKMCIVFIFKAAKVIYAGVIFAHQNRILISMKTKCLVLTCYLDAATIHKFVFS